MRSLLVLSLILIPTGALAQGKKPVTDLFVGAMSEMTVTAGPIPPPPGADPRGPRYYPEKAQLERVEGKVTLQCGDNGQGRPVDCRVLDEAPKGWGFADHSAVMISAFPWKPQQNLLQTPFRIINIRYQSPNPTAPYPKGVMPNFIDRPVARHLKSIAAKVAPNARGDGWAGIECTATRTAVLTDCTTLVEFPEGKGFGDLLLALAPRVKIETKDVEGVPVADRPVRLMAWLRVIP